LAPESPIAHFEFVAGPQRGSRLTLYPARLLHEGAGHMESMPLDALAAVGAVYARDERRIGWGAVLIVAALMLLALSRPLANLAADAGAQVADAQAIGKLLRATLAALESLANLLPLAAGACLAGGIALIALGWIGTTTLTLMLPAGERAYAVRGRNALLVDFATLLAERAAQRGR
jgi:hypothetical protein